MKDKKKKKSKVFYGGILECINCKEEKKEKEFYANYDESSDTGKIPYCKECLKKMIGNDNGSVSLDKVKKTLQLMDRPFIADIWKISVQAGGDIFGVYIKNIALPPMKYYKWGDSQFDPRDTTNLNYTTFHTTTKKFKITEAIVIKWGAGYKLEEYEAFERKYEFLKNNYPEKTSMHTEALFKYIRYSVKEELSTAADLVNDAKSWGALAKDAATAAKITPHQLSKSDLQDGLTTFGQLARAVEQAVDIIAILPKFKKKPQDSVDFTLWCYINYIRDMKGLPLCEYEEIYQFYEERKKEQEQLIKDMKEKAKKEALQNESSDDSDETGGW